MTSALTSFLSPHLLIAPGGADCKFALNKQKLMVGNVELRMYFDFL
jgi:hypothetical protein